MDRVGPEEQEGGSWQQLALLCLAWLGFNLEGRPWSTLKVGELTEACCSYVGVLLLLLLLPSATFVSISPIFFFLFFLFFFFFSRIGAAISSDVSLFSFFSWPGLLSLVLPNSGGNTPALQTKCCELSGIEKPTLGGEVRTRSSVGESENVIGAARPGALNAHTRARNRQTDTDTQRQHNVRKLSSPERRDVVMS